MTPALIADTGGLLRALADDRKGNRAWPEFARAISSAVAVVVPALVLAEVDYFLRKRRSAMRKLLADILDPKSTYELVPPSAPDLMRAMQFDLKFADLSLGLVDGTIAAVAERRRIHRILTTDRARFTAIRIGERYDRSLTVLP